ncbi:MAG: hypothetical protein IPP94_08245 [Ignavibacteria bacterium]|nr:hypothetical protein [Ignavibacteria bacterium]
MNRAGQLFRQAAAILANSKYTALGAFYRRLKAKHGPRVAMKAVARKLAVQFYNVSSMAWHTWKQVLNRISRNTKRP